MDTKTTEPEQLKRLEVLVANTQRVYDDCEFTDSLRLALGRQLAHCKICLVEVRTVQETSQITNDPIVLSWLTLLERVLTRLLDILQWQPQGCCALLQCPPDPTDQIIELRHIVGNLDTDILKFKEALSPPRRPLPIQRTGSARVSFSLPSRPPLQAFDVEHSSNKMQTSLPNLHSACSSNNTSMSVINITNTSMPNITMSIAPTNTTTATTNHINHGNNNNNNHNGSHGHPDPHTPPQLPRRGSLRFSLSSSITPLPIHSIAAETSNSSNSTSTTTSKPQHTNTANAVTSPSTVRALVHELGGDEREQLYHPATVLDLDK